MAGGGEFENPPEDMDVDNDVPDEIGWWEDEEVVQKERERFERCIYLANEAHIELIHALPEDIRPTLDSVLAYTEWVSLGDWHLFESDVHALARIVENFLVSQENN